MDANLLRVHGMSAPLSRLAEKLGLRNVVNMFDLFGQLNVPLLPDSLFGRSGKRPMDAAYFAGRNFSKETAWPIGGLSTKAEAAGKIRVFALVDGWTQSVLGPLHDHLFSIIRKLPNDGTFNQYSSVERCMEKAKSYGQSFGYDLSAATDRLPIDLQVAVLQPIIGVEAAAL